GRGRRGGTRWSWGRPAPATRWSRCPRQPSSPPGDPPPGRSSASRPAPGARPGPGPAEPGGPSCSTGSWSSPERRTLPVPSPEPLLLLAPLLLAGLARSSEAGQLPPPHPPLGPSPHRGPGAGPAGPPGPEGGGPPAPLAERTLGVAAADGGAPELLGRLHRQVIRRLAHPRVEPLDGREPLHREHLVQRRRGEVPVVRPSGHHHRAERKHLG